MHDVGSYGWLLALAPKYSADNAARQSFPHAARAQPLRLSQCACSGEKKRKNHARNFCLDPPRSLHNYLQTWPMRQRSSRTLSLSKTATSKQLPRDTFGLLQKGHALTLALPKLAFHTLRRTLRPISPRSTRTTTSVSPPILRSWAMYYHMSPRRSSAFRNGTLTPKSAR